MSVIEVKNIKKSFAGIDVLKGINFHVNQSEVVCLIGPSGSGKSTMLRCLNRLEELDGGTININNQDLYDRKLNPNKLREKLGMVFQSFNLFPHLSVLENVTLAPVTLGKLHKKDCYRKSSNTIRKSWFGG